MKDEWAQDSFRSKAEPEGWGLTGHSGGYVIDCFMVIKVIFRGILWVLVRREPKDEGDPRACGAVVDKTRAAAGLRHTADRNHGCLGFAKPAARRLAGGGSGRGATAATHAGGRLFVPDGT